MTTEHLELTDIKIDGGTQPREAISEETVAEYAEAIREGAAFPAVIVFCDGATHWLVDGFHRYHAHRRADKETIEAIVHQGTLRDAILHSLAANVDHGLRRTNADKRKAVLTMLTNELVATDADGNPWSDREIARRCCVHHTFVGRFRRESGVLTGAKHQSASSDGRSYTTKHGTKSVMKTGNINRNRSPQRKPGGIARNAMMPTRGHSSPARKTALELPHDPHWAARGLLSAFGADFVRTLITELTNCMKGLDT